MDCWIWTNSLSSSHKANLEISDQHASHMGLTRVDLGQITHMWHQDTTFSWMKINSLSRTSNLFLTTLSCDSWPYQCLLNSHWRWIFTVLSDFCQACHKHRSLTSSTVLFLINRSNSGQTEINGWKMTVTWSFWSWIAVICTRIIIAHTRILPYQKMCTPIFAYQLCEAYAGRHSLLSWCN